MAELLRANVLANFAYFRRSRLLIAFALVFLLLTGLTSLPTFFINSSVQNFNSLQEIYSTMNVFLLLFAAGLGLFVVSSHLRNRSLKMVFTKPCSPAVWLLSDSYRRWSLRCSSILSSWPPRAACPFFRPCRFRPAFCLFFFVTSWPRRASSRVCCCFPR